MNLKMQVVGNEGNHFEVHGQPPFGKNRMNCGHEPQSAGKPDALQTLRALVKDSPTARQRLECVELAPAFPLRFMERTAVERSFSCRAFLPT